MYDKPKTYEAEHKGRKVQVTIPGAELRHIDAETIHNWTQRYADLPYYADLPEVVRMAILADHHRHHSQGKNASEAAEQLVARFPEHLTL